MTRTRKLGIAAVVILVVVGVLLLVRRDEPPIVAKFLRYENDGESVVIQITNRSRSPIGCTVAFERNRHTWLDSKDLEAQSGLELQLPTIQGGLRISNVVVGYRLPHGAFHRRLGAVLERVGIDIEYTPSEFSEILLALPPPKTPLP